THHSLAISHEPPVPYEPSSTRPVHAPCLPFLGPPIAPWPSPIGHPVPYESSPTGPAYTPWLPFLSPPI
ncbi:hypothetical protein PAXRUDRAFT_105499, partial [Paxillus rubicundulus Ve08.2h10]